MDITNLCPALLEESSYGTRSNFLESGRDYRIEYLVARYNWVLMGRRKYSEYEDGALKCSKKMKIGGTSDTPTEPKKRKRGREDDGYCSDGNSSSKRASTCPKNPNFDDDEDDEEIPPIKREGAGMSTDEEHFSTTLSNVASNHTPSDRSHSLTQNPNLQERPAPHPLNRTYQPNALSLAAQSLRTTIRIHIEQTRPTLPRPTLRRLTARHTNARDPASQ